MWIVGSPVVLWKQYLNNNDAVIYIILAYKKLPFKFCSKYNIHFPYTIYKYKYIQYFFGMWKYTVYLGKHVILKIHTKPLFKLKEYIKFIREVGTIFDKNKKNDSTNGSDLIYLYSIYFQNKTYLHYLCR